MLEPSFVGYLARDEFEDASIADVGEVADIVRVRIRDVGGKTFVAIFEGVCAVRANEPVGMMPYAIGEWSGEPPFRRFVFLNWDDNSDGFLHIDARTASFREA